MRFVLISCYSLLMVLRSPALLAQETPSAIIEHLRSTYAAMASYSDTGTTLKEYGTNSQDESTFTTYFTRAPRHFFFDYRKPGGDRSVIWGDPDAFHVWWKATGQVSEYPNPKNTGALTLTDYPTGGTVSKIPPLLYAKAGLPGAVTEFEPERVVGTEEVGGNKCYRVQGTSSDTFGQTGKKVNVRAVTLWIDASTYLLRKSVEEPPAVAGSINRTTTTFTPKANPTLDDASFHFSPPK